MTTLKPQPERCVEIIGSIEGLAEIPEGASTHLTLGAYDGVHIGHQALIRRTVETAEERGALSVVFTFRNHPLSILAPSYVPPRLTPDDVRIRMFSEMGVRILVLVEFDHALAQLTATEFTREILVKRLRIRHVVCGHNFHFGQGGAEDAQFLREKGAEMGFTVEQLEPVKVRGVIVNSSRIRELLTQGLVSTAAEFLGRPYSIRGEVARGTGRGRTLTYPTANIVPCEDILIPGSGVYVVRVIVDGAPHGGMMSIGTNPTFPPEHFSIEAHLFDFNGNLMGKVIEVEFIHRMRMEMKFASAEALVLQMRRDEMSARKFLKGYITKTP